jgi:ribose 5-phosphate isomerase A
MGGTPKLREGFTTDNGNIIIDVHGMEITDAIKAEADFNKLAGVVTIGLFASRPADVLILGTPNGAVTV